MGSVFGVILMTAVIRHLFLASNHKRMAWVISALIAAPVMFVAGGIGYSDGGPFAAMEGLVFAGIGLIVAAIAAAGWAKFKQDAEYIYVRPKRWVLALCWFYLVLIVGVSALVITTESATLFA